MAFVNNVMIIRRDLITRIASLFRQERLIGEIDRIPLEITRNLAADERCCKHKARAVVKYKIMAILGYGREEEKDELDTLAFYAERALNKEADSGRILTVVDEACTSCIKSSFVVTNLCKGCIAHPCINNCPKKAISRNGSGQAEIDPGKCVSCGICKNLCPYHTIVYMPVPCEEACPVGAIGKNENGIEKIDAEKCILCGKCINACPFGSIMEKTDLLDVMRLLRDKRPVNALIAPSIFGQYSVHPGAVTDALKKLGFSNVLEVASGAMVTTSKEADELEEKSGKEGHFITTSCCSSWVLTVEKHIPAMKQYLSHTLSPMAYTAMLSREKYPEASVVFIGPCLSKRKEAMDNKDIDFTLTFEELGCLLNGWNIPVLECENLPVDNNINMAARNFCLSGGVSEAIRQKRGTDINALIINGIDSKQIRVLSSIANSGCCESDLIEVMACEGGCIAGPCSHEFPKDSRKFYDRNMKGFR